MMNFNNESRGGNAGLVVISIAVNIILCYYSTSLYTLLCAAWYSVLVVVYTAASSMFKSLRVRVHAILSGAFALAANTWYARDIAWGLLLTALMVSIAYLGLALWWESKSHRVREKSE